MNLHLITVHVLLLLLLVNPIKSQTQQCKCNNFHWRFVYSHLFALQSVKSKQNDDYCD